MSRGVQSELGGLDHADRPLLTLLQTAAARSDSLEEETVPHQHVSRRINRF